MAVFKIKQRLKDGSYKTIDLVADKLGDGAKTEVNTIVENNTTVIQNSTDIVNLQNGKNKIFYQSTQPTSGMITGDLWIKPTSGTVTDEPNYVVGGSAVKCGYQINGHEVYQKIFKFTSLNTEKTIALGISSYSMVWINTGDSFLRHANSKLTYPLPTIGYTTTFNDKINVYIEGDNLKLKSSSGWNDQWAFYVAVRYY